MKRELQPNPQTNHLQTFHPRIHPLNPPDPYWAARGKENQRDHGSIGKLYLSERSMELTISDQSSYGASYQSGGTISDPTSVPQAYSNDPESAAFASSSTGPINGSGSGDAERANAWESRFGWRVDIMAAATYLGGPVTGMTFSFKLRFLTDI
jgi:hypothetical protein